MGPWTSGPYDLGPLVLVNIKQNSILILVGSRTGGPKDSWTIGLVAPNTYFYRSRTELVIF